MRRLIVYLARNTINGKCYVGQTGKPLSTRIGEHFNRPITPFDKAIRKYGKVGFEFSILCECSTREELNEQEKYWIAQIQCKSPKGYNLNDGGNGSNPSEETIQKMRLMNKGRIRSEESKQKNREAHLGKKASDETRKKQSESLKARFARIPHHMVGRKLSQEVKEKISKANKGKNIGPKNGMFGRPCATKGIPWSDESREKARLSHIGIPQSLETRMRRSLTIKATLAAKRVTI